MKKRTKLLLSILLSGSMALNATAYFHPSVHATETENAISATTFVQTMDLYQNGGYPASPATCDSFSKAASKVSIQSVTLEKTLYNGLSSSSTSIDVSSFNITADELKTAMENVINSSPELFYVKSGYGYSYSGTTITTVTPQYRATGTTLKEQQTYYQTTLKEIVSQVNTSWSDLEKILFVHDYLAQNFQYDTSYTIYDCYNFFKERKGVCQAYTMTFVAVMKELGIEVSVASSDAIDHIWNVVKLDGKWYHIDVTWDDPTADRYGMASHNNLLLSDTAIATCRGGSSQYHHSWVCSYTCTDTTYDTYFWEKSSTPFQYLDSKWYYGYYDSTASDSKLNSYDFKTKTEESITSLGKWYSSGTSYYAACFSGLDVYNNKLYYNTGTTLNTYDPTTKAASTILKPSISGSIFGMRIEGQQLYYCVGYSLNNAELIYSHTLEAVVTTPTPTPVASNTPSTTPVASKAPSASPAATKAPSTSPAASKVPSASPVATKVPSASPAATKAPSASPAATKAPSASPAATKVPVTTTPVPSEVTTVTPAPSEVTTITPAPSPSTGVPTPSEVTTVTPAPSPSTGVPTPSEAATATPAPSEVATTAPSNVPTTPQPGGSISPSPAPSTPIGTLGDVNTDKQISLADAQIVLKAALKITALDETKTVLADVDSNNKLDLKDAQLILKFALKIISSFK